MIQHRKYSLQLKKHGTNKKILKSEVPRYNRQAKSQLSRYSNKIQSEDNKLQNSHELSAIKVCLDFKAQKQSRIVTRSNKQSGLNTQHKQRVAKQRRSYSFTNRNPHPKKIRHNSIFQNMNKSIEQPYLQQSKTQNPATNLNTIHLSLEFAAMCLNIEQRYMHSIDHEKTDEAFECLVELLNYSVDLNNKEFFFKVLQAMSQFYSILDEKRMALKFYSQFRQAAALLKDYKNLVISLIGISKCIGFGESSKDAIIVLKKGLEYAWYSNNRQLQLSVYDELGQRYCLMGQVQKASTYHQKYSNAILQPKQSPLRTLSKQQISVLEQAHLTHEYNTISPLFLAHLNLPIKNTESLPSFSKQIMTPRQKISNLRTENKKMEAAQIQYQMKRLFKNWMFLAETEEPNLDNFKTIKTEKQLYSAQKFSFIRSIQQNKVKHPIRSNFAQSPYRDANVRKKMSLDEQIKSFVSTPGLDKSWYENLVRRVQDDQKRKLAQVKDPVRLNKHQASIKSKSSILKSLFRHLIEYLSP